jgi:hypothetical protein
MVVEDLDLDVATAERLIALADRNQRAVAVTRLTGGSNSAVSTSEPRTGAPSW